MPWSGSAGSKTFGRTDGTRTGTQVWQQADAASVDIISTDHDTHDQDIATGLNQALMKDGGNTATANLPMGGFRHTNTGAAGSRTDYARLSDVQDGKGVYCATVGGSLNAITLTSGYAQSAYAAGQSYTFIAAYTNNDATTVDVDGLGPKDVYVGSSPVSAGMILAGTMPQITYDGTRFQLSASAPAVIGVGTIMAWPAVTVPSSCLECNGAAISRTTYSALYGVIATTYGVGDGSTTFNLPDYTDYFLRGYSGSATDGAARTDRGDGTTGIAVGTKQAAATNPHTHAFTTASDGAHTHDIAYGLAGRDAGATGTYDPTSTGSIDVTASGGAHTHTGTTDLSAGANTETRPKNILVKWIIVAFPTATAALATSLAANTFEYTFDTGTTAADPGAGKVRANNANLSSATALYISETDRRALSQATAIQQWDDSTSTVKGYLTLVDLDTQANKVRYSISGSITDNGTYDTITVTYVSGVTSLAGVNVAIMFERTGDAGSSGTNGTDGGIRWLFDSSTAMADPGAGDIRLNNATLASVTALAVSDNCAESGNPSVESFVLAWDDSTTTSLRGTIIFKKLSAPQNFAIYSITGSNTNNVGWTEVAVTHVQSSGSFSNGDTLSVNFLRTGNAGAGTGDVVGPASATDNAIARYDGTTGKLIQDSAVTIDDTTGRITGAIFPNAGLKVQDSDASHTLAIVPGSNITANRTLTVTTGDADRTVTISGNATISQDYSTTGNPQFATIELGAASDTTISRSSAGVIAVEGVTVALNSTSATHTAGTVELGAATDTTLSRSAAGELAVEGVVVKKVGKETIYIPAAAMTARTTNGAAAGTVETTTNKVMFSTLDFDTTTQEFAQFSIRMPKSWNESTVTAIFTWSHASTTTNFGVVWALEGVALSDADAGDAAFGTAQQIADTGGTTNTIYITSATPAITIGGTPAAEDWVVFQVKRVPADGSDTMAIDARLHGVTLYFTTDASTDA